MSTYPEDFFQLVPLQARATPETFIHAVADFNCVGDGVTDNATALIAMRDAMLAENDRFYHIYFPPGVYHYDNNRWLMGLRRYVVDAYGASFLNTHTTSPWGLDRQPLNNRSPFDDRGDTTGGPLHVNGDLIDTAARQATSVFTSTVGDAANFAAGDRVLIYGYPQQFTSDPPNPRYFQYNVVVSANDTTGEVVLLHRLTYDFDERWGDWWDTAGSAALTNGAPRILSLDRAAFVQSDISIIRGATFPQRPDFPDVFYAFFLSSDYQEMTDVTARHLTPSCTRYQVLRRSNVELAEIDKIIDTCLIEDCRFTEVAGSNGSLVAAQGVNQVILHRNVCDGVTRLGARYIHVEDNDLYAAEPDDFAILKGDARPILHATIRHNRFHNVQGADLEYCVGFDVNDFTVDAVSGTNILVTFGDAESKLVVGRLAVGQTLICPANSKSGMVTAIYDNGTGSVVIEGTWPTPVVAESWRYYQCQMLDLAGNQVIGVQKPILNPIKNVWRSTRDRNLRIDIPTAADATYVFETESEIAYCLDRLSIICTSGTVTAKVQINAADVTGLTAVAVSSTRARAYATGASDTNRCPEGGRVTLVLSSNSAALGVEASLLVRPD